MLPRLLCTDLKGLNGHRGVKKAVAGGCRGLRVKQGPLGYRTGWLGSQWGLGGRSKFAGVCPAWGAPPGHVAG